MGIIVALISLLGLLALIDAVVRYRRTVFHDPVELTPEQRAACSRIVDAGLGRPWICREAIDRGTCPCLPCDNLERELRGELAQTARLRRSA
ncbi:MAG: hypothetical protein GVY29_00195 [Spirochaetes bacterium]|jgi:hypothetical protein|nr:hypothetical protein [Spirochaetota bacterium]